MENDSKILKCLITYLPGDIYEILGISIEGVGKDGFGGFGVMYRVVEKMFLLRL